MHSSHSYSEYVGNETGVLESASLENESELTSLHGLFQQRYLRPFEAWITNRASHLREIDTVFYPFSGADILYAYALNPRAKHYVLCGLEACDRMEALSPMTMSDSTSLLKHYFEYGFFVTKDLHAGIEDTLHGSVEPLFCTLLKLMGAEILSVKSLNLSERGKTMGGLTMASTDHGLHLMFDAGHGVQNLYYFKRDLRDEYEINNREVYDFTQSLGPFQVFAKSASYLLHEANFSKVHDFIFEQSAALLQDPSHIPYEKLVERGWSVKLFGAYQQAPKVFPQYEQPSLRESRTLECMDFGFGYLFESHRASLILAQPGEGGRQIALPS